MFRFIPKLPMRDKHRTLAYYRRLGFSVKSDYGDYLLMEAGGSEVHFFAYPDLDPEQNYGQMYIQSADATGVYQQFQAAGVEIHPNGPLQRKPWGMLEFSLLDPDKNLLTFGTEV